MMLRLIAAGLPCVLAAPRPNFLVIFVDDMGINQIDVPTPEGAHGYTGDGGQVATPNFARLAAEGMTFQTWYSAFHVCSPSRGAMMTGRLPVRLGIGLPCGDGPECGGSGLNLVFTAEAVGGLPHNETTTADALASAGYATGMLGKWHLGQRPEYLPTRRGFDEYLGVPFSQDMGTSPWEGAAPAEPFQPTPLALLANETVVEQPVDLGGLTAKYAAFAADFIARRSRAPPDAAEATPWYLYASLNHVHAPASCAARFCGASARGAIGDALLDADALVGALLDALDAANATASTLVLLTSDNGAPLAQDALGNLPLRGGKAQTWEGGYREPALARWPGVVARGAWSEALAATVDVHVTLLALAGAPLAPGRAYDGVDLTPTLRGDAAAPPPRACYPFYGYADARNASDGANLAAVRCGAFKAYWRTDSDVANATKAGYQDPPLAFDLVADPGEAAPLDPASDAWAAAMAPILAWRDEHLASLDVVPSMNALGSDRRFAICGAPGSVPRNCSLTPENWRPPECDVPACVATGMLNCSLATAGGGSDVATATAAAAAGAPNLAAARVTSAT